jgi:hypothetical protein
MVGTGGQRPLPGYGLGYQETVLPLPTGRTLGCSTQKRAKKKKLTKFLFRMDILCQILHVFCVLNFVKENYT